MSYVKWNGYVKWHCYLFKQVFFEKPWRVNYEKRQDRVKKLVKQAEYF